MCVQIDLNYGLRFWAARWRVCVVSVYLCVCVCVSVSVCVFVWLRARNGSEWGQRSCVPVRVCGYGTRPAAGVAVLF